MRRAIRTLSLAAMIAGPAVIPHLLASDLHSEHLGRIGGVPVAVNVDNYVRAETAMQFDRFVRMAGGVNRWFHDRQPTPHDKQNVIRMNRDTLYSFAIVDISRGATVTMPDAGGRYMTVMVVNEEEYIHDVFHRAGVHRLTVDEFHSPYVLLAGRTLVDSSDPEDVQAANVLQDQLVIEASSSVAYSHPEYDQDSYKATYEALIALSRGVPDTRGMFGKKEEVGETRHMIGAAFGWGGLPVSEAYYLTVEPDLPVGEYRITVKDVPVDAFWSISLYDGDGYFQKNELDAYSVNNISGTPHPDGSFSVHFGGCGDARVNCLPIMDGWNYTVRLYRPREEILDGSWMFPAVRPLP